MEKQLLKVILFICLIFVSWNSFAQTQTISTPGTNTFVVPTNTKALIIEVWGGGGVGGRDVGGGGGAGSYARSLISIPYSSSYTYTVGSGGTGNTGTSRNGGTSSFGTGPVLVSAGGGNYGVNSGTGGTGGTATIGNQALSAGGNGATGGGNSGGNGGNSPSGGTGGTGGTNTNIAGTNGGIPGGGGGGAGKNSNTNASGGNGQIRISYILLTSTTGTDTQTICSGSSITSINYSVPSGSTATVTNLPSGVTSNFNSALGTLTLSGIPTNNSTFNINIVTGYGVTLSTSGSISIIPETQIDNQPVGTTYCQDDTPTDLSVSASGTGTISYEWFSNTTNSNTGGTSVGTGTTFTPPTDTDGNIFYYAVASSSVCGTATSDVVEIIVTPETQIDSQPAGATYCQDDTPTDLSVSASGTGTISYEWFSNTTNSNTGGTSVGTGSTFTPPTDTDGNIFYYAVASSSVCGTATSDVVEIIVTPETQIDSQPAGATYCQDDTPTDLSVSASGTGTFSYEWFSNTTNSNTGGTSVGTGSTFTPPTDTDGNIFYYAVASSSICGTATSDVVEIIVTPETQISSQPVGATYCQDDTPTDLSVSASGTGTFSYEWFSNTTNSNTGGTSVGTGSNFTPPTDTDGNIFYYAVASSSICGTATSDVVEIIVTPETLITSHPSSVDQTQCINDGFNQLEIIASGTGSLNYQWYSNTTNSVSGPNVTPVGTNSATFTPPSTTPGTLYYFAEVTANCGVLTSNVSGAITVNPNTSIDSESLAAQSACFGQTTFSSISVTASGTGTLNYQWYRNTSASTTGGTPVGIDSPSYTPDASTIGTLYYYVEVSSDCGPTVTSSASGAFIVDPITAITTQPDTMGEVECFGDGFSEISVSAVGGDLTYQWYSTSTPINSGGTAVTGATSANFTPPSTTLGSNYYYVIVTGNCGIESSDVSGEYIVTPPITTVTDHPSTTDQTVCNGGTFSPLSVAAIGEGTVSYQWYSNTSNSNSGGTLITGANTDTYTPPTTTNGTTYYYAIANSDCGTVPTNVSGAFTVTPLTEITVEELDAQAICDGDTFDPISITATGTGTITYQWYSNATNSNSGGTLITGATADTYNPPATAAGTTTYYYVTISSSCGPDVTSSASGAFTVNPLPIPTFVAEPTSDICVGTSVTYTTQSGSGEHDYVWSILGTSGSDYTITSGGTGNSDPTVTLTWLTDGSKDVSVSYTNANNCIATTTADNTILVNPLPVPTFEVEPTAPVCVGSSVTYTTQSGSGESNYQWSIPGTSGVDYTITSGGNGTSDPSITLTWLTDGSKDVSVSYTNANNCVATTTADNTLLVNPLPVPTFTTSPGANVCEQSDVTYTTQSGKSDYTWNIAGTEGTDYTITSGGTSSDETVIIQWLTTGSQTVEVSYTEPSTGCIATSAASSTTDVEPFATVGATSVAFPSVCSNNPTLTPFTQPTTGVTGIGTPTGLPAGVTATFNSSTGNIEFSGNVSGAATGLYTYSIPLTGNCINGLEATGTIDVTPDYEITAISSVSATSIGGSASVTFYGDPTKMLNGTYQLYYQIKQGSGSFSAPIAVTATVNNGKGTFSTTAINSNVDTYTVQILSIKKSTDVCNITLPSPPTTYFGVCSAVFSGNSTFYVPANVYSITIEVYGGGGGGNSGGGGGGAYSIRENIPVTPGEPLAAFVGAGGTKGVNGGVSYVTRDSNIADQLTNSLVYANGGNGSTSGSAAGGTFDPRYSGSNGNNSSGNNGGKGGGPLGGIGGANKNNGSTPGGGGGGWSGTKGVGGSGLVVISYSCPDADNTDCMTIIDDGSKSGYTVVEYTCDDTWTAPEGLAEFTVFVGSGGGGGGGGEGSGGGGSGTLIVQTFSTTNPYGLPAGSDFDIEVGLGGAGAGSINLPGWDGESSSFTGSIDGSSILISVPGGGGGGSRTNNPGGDGASGGGGGANKDPNDNTAGTVGAGGNPISVTYTGTNVIVYQGNVGGNGDFSEPQNSIAGGGGGGLTPWSNGNDGQHGKAAGNGQGEGGRGGDGIILTLGDSTRYYGAGGGGIGEYFNGTEKIGEGGTADGITIGGDGNLDIFNTNGIGLPGKDQTGSGGGAGYAGGGSGGDGVVYIVYSNFSILEVEYLYFEASYQESDRSGKLKWATSQEWENSHFEIERSINNVKNWEKIGEVEGAGYSSEAIEYEFIDKNLPVNGGMIYYRLKQVDFEGDFTYSVTRSIQANPKNGSGYWVAYPNPSGRTEYVNLSLLNPSVYQDEPIIVRISDSKGVSESYTVHSPEDVSNTVNYHLRNSDHGLFIIQLLWGKHEQQIKIIRK